MSKENKWISREINEYLGKINEYLGKLYKYLGK